MEVGLDWSCETVRERWALEEADNVRSLHTRLETNSRTTGVRVGRRVVRWVGGVLHEAQPMFVGNLLGMGEASSEQECL